MDAITNQNTINNSINNPINNPINNSLNNPLNNSINQINNQINNSTFNEFDFEGDLEPQIRSRSYTWPSNRPDQQTTDYNHTLETCAEVGSSSSFTTLIPSTTDNILFEQDESSDPQEDLSPQSQVKKNSSRRNAWGNYVLHCYF